MKCCLYILTALVGLASAQNKPDTAAASLPSSVANIELTVYLVYGFAQAQAVAADKLPQDLSAIFQQLGGVFAYKSYKLIEAVILRGRNNVGSEVAGDLPDNSHYDFRYSRARLSGETPRLVHLDSLRLEIVMRRLGRLDPAPVALVSTDLDIREGQKTVVGKSAVNRTDALFMVIVARVVE